MALYLLANVCITAIVFISLRGCGGAPARYKLYLCLIGLVSWCLPWWRIPALSSDHIAVVKNVTGPVLEYVAADVTRLSSPESLSVSLVMVVFTLCFLGLGYFVIETILTAKKMAVLKLRSERRSDLWSLLNAHGPMPELRVVAGINNAFTTGVFRPVVWLDEKLVSRHPVEAVLLHELTHVRRNDNALLFIIHAVCRGLWWNPIVWLLTWLCRCYIELSCDEDCAGAMPSYQTRLAQLVLFREAKVAPVLSTAFFQWSNFNIHRVKRLEGVHKMKKPYWFSVAALVVVAGLMSMVPTFATEGAPVTTMLEVEFSEANGNQHKTEYEMKEAGEIVAKVNEYAKGKNIRVDRVQENRLQSVQVRVASLAEFEAINALIENNFSTYGFDEQLSEPAKPGIPLDVRISLSHNQGEKMEQHILATNQNWAGARTSAYQVRLLPTLKGERVHIASELIYLGDGEPQIIASPSFISELGAQVELSTEEEGRDGVQISVDLAIEVNRIL